MSSVKQQYEDQPPKTRIDWLRAEIADNSTAYLLLAPATVFLLAVVAYPILETFRLSLYASPTDSPVETFVGLEHYVAIFQSTFFYQLLWQTGRWVVVSVVLKTILGLLIAVHLNQQIAGRKFFRTAFLIPWGIPYAISAVVFRWIQHPQYGYLNGILLELGLISSPIGILGNPSTAWFGAVLADVWIGTPFMAIIFLAGLQSIPDDLYEAAAVGGAEWWHQFRYITLPQLKSVILIATLLSTIWTFVSFDVIWTMTRGGPMNSSATLVIWIYRVAFDQGNLGEAAAFSVIGFVFLLAFAVLYLRLYTRGGDSI